MGGDHTEAFYLWHGIASSTRTGYDNAPSQYVAFCRSKGYSAPFFPATAARVGPWIANVGQRLAREKGGLGAKALKRRISALKSHHIDLGMDPAQITSPRVERVIQGVHKYHGVMTKPQALPITLPILRRILRRLRLFPDAYGGPLASAALIAAFALTFACFLRLGEVVYQDFDARFNLRIASVDLRDTGNPTLTIPASKTDPFRMGVTVVIPDGPADVCPVHALWRYFALRAETNADAPLFRLGALPFTRARVVRVLGKCLTDAGLPARGYTGHSFRRGATTWASSISMSSTDIKTLGRWNSDCFKLYVDAGAPSHARAGRRLLSAPASESSLPPSGIPQPGQIWRPSL